MLEKTNKQTRRPMTRVGEDVERLAALGSGGGRGLQRGAGTVETRMDLRKLKHKDHLSQQFCKLPGPDLHTRVNKSHRIKWHRRTVCRSRHGVTVSLRKEGNSDTRAAQRTLGRRETNQPQRTKTEQSTHAKSPGQPHSETESRRRLPWSGGGTGDLRFNGDPVSVFR